VALESHLQSCAECSAIVGDLRRVVRRAGTLKQRAPERDLWPGIASRIGAILVEPDRVVDPSSHRRSPQRWSFSLPQLAAASIALMTLSGGAVWLLRIAAPPSVTAPFAGAPSSSQTVVNAAVRPSATQSYAAAVADLERVLADGRGQLDSTTVRVIEQNLQAIDRAIAQAQRALEADPVDLYLNTHLAQTMRRKLELLRQAAGLVPVS
jgi:hypothetical protein